jgi:hypothetical protein
MQFLHYSFIIYILTKTKGWQQILKITHNSYFKHEIMLSYYQKASNTIYLNTII